MHQPVQHSNQKIIYQSTAPSQTNQSQIYQQQQHQLQATIQPVQQSVHQQPHPQIISTHIQQHQPVIQQQQVQKQQYQLPIPNNDDEVQQIVSKLIYLYLMVESTNEKERLKFCDKKEFYPEIGFNFLKNYEKIMEKKRLEQQQKSQSQNFFDFSKAPQTIQYNFIDKFKKGFIFPSQILAFLDQRGFKASEAEVNAVFESFSSNTVEEGLDYQGFLNIILPQSIPEKKVEIMKRKIIYETTGLNENLKIQFQDILFEIIQLEINLIRISEKQKLKLINDLKWNPVKAFEQLDIENNGHLNYNSIDSLIRKIGKNFVPREYLFLLKRMNKNDGEDTITFQNFKELLTPNLPYFRNDQQNTQKPQLYASSCKKSVASSSNMSKIFDNNLNQTRNANSIIPPQQLQQGQKQNTEDGLYFVDQRGRIVEQPHPEMQQYLKRNPELQEIVNNNQHLQEQDQDGKYYLIPETEYSHKHFDIIPKKIKPQRPLQYGLESNYQNQQQQNLNNMNNANNIQMSQYGEQSNIRDRQMLQTQKNMLLNNYNPNLQNQAAQQIPLLKDIHDAQQYQSTKKEILQPFQSQNLPQQSQLLNQAQIQSQQNLLQRDSQQRGVQNQQQLPINENMEITQYYSQNLNQYNKDIRNAALDISKNVQKNNSLQASFIQNNQNFNQGQKSNIFGKEGQMQQSQFPKQPQFNNQLQFNATNPNQKSMYVNFNANNNNINNINNQSQIRNN